MGRRVPVPSCLFSFFLLLVSALSPGSPFSTSPLLPDICFFPNVAVRCRLTANEIQPLFQRPGSYSRSPYRQLSAGLLDLFPSELTSFIIFPALTSKGRRGVRVSHAVTRAHVFERECPRRETNESRHVSGESKNGGACQLNIIYDLQRRIDIGATC